MTKPAFKKKLMSNLLYARILMGASLEFHIIYVAFGIGLPFLLMITEGFALVTGEECYHVLARSWTRPVVLLFAIGAVSGTILSFELGLLWPVFMGFSGPMIGLAFWMEGFAFFIEAIFAALYVYGRNKLSRRALFLCTIPMALGAAASAVFVISANGWMNSPSGFNLAKGGPVNIRPWLAFTNSAWPHEAMHATLAAYTACFFTVSGVYALRLIRKNYTPQNRLGLSLSLALGCILALLMLFTGDYAARWVAYNQKTKLAALEAVPHTIAGAPLTIGGWLDKKTNTVRYGIPIPKLLSLLSYGNPNATVLGLDAFKPGLTPNANLVHPVFDLMVAGFFIMFLAALWFWIARWRGKEVFSRRLYLVPVLIATPFGILSQGAGWAVTEFGRQPWIASCVMLVAKGVTPAPAGWMLAAFAFVYLALTAGLVRLLFASGAKKAGIKSGLRNQGDFHGEST